VTENHGVGSSILSLGTIVRADFFESEVDQITFVSPRCELWAAS
jgi:hypothetical protein